MVIRKFNIKRIAIRLPVTDATRIINRANPTLLLGSSHPGYFPRSFMAFRVGVQQLPDHSLIRRFVLSSLPLEELHTASTQSNRDLDPLLLENQLFGRRQKVRNDPELTQRFIGVSDFPAHKFVSLCASNLPHKCGRLVHGK
jgi:hypothetical protein